MNNLHNVTEADYIAQMESFRPEVYNKYLKPGSIVYDLGAFKGVLTVQFAKMGYEVIAVEASTRNYPDLLINTTSLKNVTCINKAIHETDKGLVHTRFNDCLGLDHPEQPIDYISLNTLIEKYLFPTPDFIKMDIEGMETVVLKSCDNIFKNIRPIWQLSIHDTEPHGKICIYSDFPGFVYPEKGGYIFNNIFNFNYKAFTLDMKPVDNIGGFEEYFLIPDEKII